MESFKKEFETEGITDLDTPADKLVKTDKTKFDEKEVQLKAVVEKLGGKFPIEKKKSSGGSSGRGESSINPASRRTFKMLGIGQRR